MNPDLVAATMSDFGRGRVHHARRTFARAATEQNRRLRGHQFDLRGASVGIAGRGARCWSSSAVAARCGRSGSSAVLVELAELAVARTAVAIAGGRGAVLVELVRAEIAVAASSARSPRGEWRRVVCGGGRVTIAARWVASTSSTGAHQSLAAIITTRTRTTTIAGQPTAASSSAPRLLRPWPARHLGRRRGGETAADAHRGARSRLVELGELAVAGVCGAWSSSRSASVRGAVLVELVLAAHRAAIASPDRRHAATVDVRPGLRGAENAAGSAHDRGPRDPG